jgi:hypothetical protein
MVRGAMGRAIGGELEALGQGIGITCSNNFDVLLWNAQWRQHQRGRRVKL